MDGSESNQIPPDRIPIERLLSTGVPRRTKPPPQKRSARIRNACERCKVRKTKCDEGIPACSNCQKAGTSCVTEPSRAPKHETSKALQDRVRWLEEIVRTRCSDIDLSQEPRILITPESSAQDGISLNRLSAMPQTHRPSSVDETHRENLAHEIGLVSVTAGQDPRYVGPSSGYSFAKLVLANARPPRQQESLPDSCNFQATSLLDKETFRVPAAKMPSHIEHCIQLSAAYWENVQFQYPFLHKPTHMKLIDHVINSETNSPVATFQVYMVLAISTTILSRRLKAPLSSEGYCATAMTYFDQVQLEGSLEGLQCLLLLQMYALHNPSLGLNVWYLSYQCIASVLDLGLQRDVRAGKNLSFLTQEMRTRIFWSVYSLDRTLATIMGRPIGLRDEGCELRLPQDIEDDALSKLEPRQRLENYTPSDITLSIHLFKLSQLNSEIKYIANSVSHKAPPYSYPQIPDVLAWKDDVLRRLRQWVSETPRCRGTQTHVAKFVEIKYHEVVMLLLRPSPAIPHPSHESLKLCQHSALAVIRNFDELYNKNCLPYTWPTVHSVFLATISMLYCIWHVPSITRATELDTLMTGLKSASGVLSALGEHWFSAKRSRDLLDELSQTTIRWLIDLELKQKTPAADMNSEAQATSGAGSLPMASAANNDGKGTQAQAVEEQLANSSPFLDAIRNYEPSASMLSFLDETNPIFDIDSIMQGVFNDYYQPDIEFGQSFPLENGQYAV